MNKPAIIESICEVLRADLATLQAAFQASRENATHAESKAENKYDTRGLEAAYLAHGQAMRAEEIAATLLAYESIPAQSLDPKTCIELNTLVQLEDQHGECRWCWIGADAGGLKFSYEGRDITIITPQSPLGAALMGREQDDAVILKINDHSTEYEILELF